MGRVWDIVRELKRKGVERRKVGKRNIKRKTVKSELGLIEEKEYRENVEKKGKRSVWEKDRKKGSNGPDKTERKKCTKKKGK